jgi:fatty-acyl-CoA synthase
MFFAAGGTVVLMDRFDAGEALRLIQKHRLNATFGVPLMLRDLMDSPEFAAADLTSLRLIAYGAQDPTDMMAEVRSAFEARGAGSTATGLDLIHIYGLTEGGPFIAALPPEYSSTDPESIGFPVPGVQVSLQDDEGNEVPDGEPGEICVRSPAVMTRYWRNPEATEAAFRNGWLLTGDIAFCGDGGLLYVVDRKKETIRSAGENVYPKEVEREVLAHPKVRDVAVLGVADDRWDERVVAIVELEPGTTLTLQELREFLRPRLAGFKCPKTLKIVDKIPKTDVGKTAKGVLRETYGGAFARQKAKQAKTTT